MGAKVLKKMEEDKRIKETRTLLQNESDRRDKVMEKLSSGEVVGGLSAEEKAGLSRLFCMADSISNLIEEELGKGYVPDGLRAQRWAIVSMLSVVVHCIVEPLVLMPVADGTMDLFGEVVEYVERAKDKIGRAVKEGKDPLHYLRQDKTQNTKPGVANGQGEAIVKEMEKAGAKTTQCD